MQLVNMYLWMHEIRWISLGQGTQMTSVLAQKPPSQLCIKYFDANATHGIKGAVQHRMNCFHFASAP